jgi:hypothetical protein
LANALDRRRITDMQGFRTFSFGLGLAILPQVVTYISNFDFVRVFGLSPDAASLIGLVVVALRAVTSTKIFQGK